MKKLLTLLLALVLSMGMFTACSGDESVDFKIGLVCLHNEDSSYDANFINAMKDAIKETGLTDKNLVIATMVPEDNCRDSIVRLADSGCDVVFGDSFGYEAEMIKAAKEYKDVEFCHGTGVRAKTEGLDNYHNAFAAIYQGRYISGVAAGLKLQDMITKNEIKDTNKDANGNIKLGYVGAMAFAEVISGYTAWYLGVKSIVPNVVMTVKFTGSWYDELNEKATALSLIDDGAAIVSQHADSTGSPSACEEKGVPNCAYNKDTKTIAPNTSLITTRINWTPYFVYIINQAKAGKKIDADWTGDLNTGSVVVTDVNEAVAAEGTADKLAEVVEQLKAGTLHVFDVARDNYITVNGEKVTTARGDGRFTPDEEFIKDGYFQESVLRSAPYFDLAIDGINAIKD